MNAEERARAIWNNRYTSDIKTEWIEDSDCPSGCHALIEKVFVSVVSEAIKQAEQAAFEEGRKEGLQEANLNQYRDRNDEAENRYAEGQREMRERAKAQAKEWWRTRRSNPEELFDDIGNLPLTALGGEPKEIQYSGQCNHQIPIGQPCKECGR